MHLSYALMQFTIQIAFPLCYKINQAKTSLEVFFIFLTYILKDFLSLRNAFSMIFISHGTEYTAVYASD